jgi:WD40 repeat protein
LNWVAWSPSGDRLLTTHGNPEVGAADNSVRVWDATTSEELLVIPGHTENVWLGGWSPNGKRIASISLDGTARVWDAATGAELLTLSTPSFWYAHVAWSPAGTYIATANYENNAKVWRAWQTTAELIAYARECCVVRELTDAERAQFGLPSR